MRDFRYDIRKLPNHSQATWGDSRLRYGARPGPRRYDASKLELVSAVAVTMPWLPAVAADFDPTQGGTMSIDLSAFGNIMQIYERKIVYFDPNHKFDNPPGTGRIYKAHESKQAAPKYYRAK